MKQNISREKPVISMTKRFILDIQRSFNFQKAINGIFQLEIIKEKAIHSVISLDAEKPFDNIQQRFMIKVLIKLGRGRL